MNVTFHVLTGIAVAATLAPRKAQCGATALLTGLGATIALHGVLDYTPHSYPLKSVVDVSVALLLFIVALSVARPDIRLLIAVCFLGSVLPDVIDLGPNLLNRHLGFRLPEAKWFPWHWKRFSGSIYDGSRAVPSAVAHLLVVAVALVLIGRRADCFSRRKHGGEE